MSQKRLNASDSFSFLAMKTENQNWTPWVRMTKEDIVDAVYSVARAFSSEEKGNRYFCFVQAKRSIGCILYGHGLFSKIEYTNSISLADLQKDFEKEMALLDAGKARTFKTTDELFTWLDKEED
jgi:hypothetical protein